ncbi:MAG: nucleoside 2-deoxyribosyltransferase, partial [Thalassolituus sp. CG17_big_fil_post_rev_8_21_14_2_50_53_8]
RDGLSIEQFDLHDNLMIEGGIALSGGIFLTHQAAEAEKYTDLTAFEA